MTPQLYFCVTATRTNSFTNLENATKSVYGHMHETDGIKLGGTN